MRCCGSRPQKTPVSVKIRTYDARRVTRVAMENVHICMAKSNNSSRGTLVAHSAVILTVSDIVFLLCLVPSDMTNKSLTKVFLRYSLASSVVAHPLHLCYCFFFSSHTYPEACRALTGAFLREQDARSCSR